MCKYIRILKWLTPFRRPPEGVRACDDRGSYRSRLRRITAAPCPFGSASVADSWARAWPSYRASCSPSRFGKTSGNAWGSKKRRRGRIRKKEEEEEEEASWGTLMASWDLPGGLLEASWGPLGASRHVLARLGASLRRLGAVLAFKKSSLAKNGKRV